MSGDIKNKPNNWRKKMKTTLKVFLAISLFGSIALADGNQGSGGSPVAHEPADSPVIAIVISAIEQYLGFSF
jgi:hypothetical protein